MAKGGRVSRRLKSIAYSATMALICVCQMPDMGSRPAIKVVANLKQFRFSTPNNTIR